MSMFHYFLRLNGLKYSLVVIRLTDCLSTKRMVILVEKLQLNKNYLEFTSIFIHNNTALHIIVLIN